MLTKAIKTQLRKSIKLRLSNVLTQSLATQSLHVLESLKSHPRFVNARSAALYMSMPALELQTDALIKACFDLNKNVYLPRCVEKTVHQRHYLEMIQVSSYTEVVALEPRGKYKLREPSTGADVMENGNLDLIIVPGVAFSRTGCRMGHGAGYYDEFLSRYLRKFGTRPYLIGVALSEQIEDEIPQEPHDWKIDTVITGNGSVYDLSPPQDVI